MYGLDPDGDDTLPWWRKAINWLRYLIILVRCAVMVFQMIRWANRYKYTFKTVK